MKSLILTAAFVMPISAAFAQQTHDLKGNYSENVLEQYRSAPTPTARPDYVQTSSISSMRVPADQMDRQIEARRVRTTPR